jgi:uncharacterized protein YciU (UPF0263 family)
VVGFFLWVLFHPTQVARILHNSQIIRREGSGLVKEALEQWLSGLELQLDQKILARICLALADDFDAKANTSTAAELRKTYLELKRSLGDQIQHDPLEAILKR